MGGQLPGASAPGFFCAANQMTPGAFRRYDGDIGQDCGSARPRNLLTLKVFLDHEIGVAQLKRA